MRWTPEGYLWLHYFFLREVSLLTRQGASLSFPSKLRADSVLCQGHPGLFMGAHDHCNSQHSL